MPEQHERFAHPAARRRLNVQLEGFGIECRQDLPLYNAIALVDRDGLNGSGNSETERRGV